MPADIRRRRALGSRSPFAVSCFLRCARAGGGWAACPLEFSFSTSRTQGVRKASGASRGKLKS